MARTRQRLGCFIDVVQRREAQGRNTDAEILKLKLMRAAAACSTNDTLSFVQPTNTEVHLSCTRNCWCLHKHVRLIRCLHDPCLSVSAR
jgi:hypothetical protein